MSIVPEHRRLEIGWTWIATAFQRTGSNREAKLLQLSHAFETLGANRVEFKTHARNEQSRNALAGIGATFEGVFRNHTIMPDGSLRDSAYFSVIVEEWPTVKAALVAGLARP
jgi:RimJ/RimL family protein N-acetyltransferase